MLDANVVITKCVQAVYEAADRYRPTRIGVITGPSCRCLTAPRWSS